LSKMGYLHYDTKTSSLATGATLIYCTAKWSRYLCVFWHVPSARC